MATRPATKSKHQHGSRTSDLLPLHPLRTVRNHRRESRHPAANYRGVNESRLHPVLLAEYQTSDKSIDPELHLGVINLVGTTDLGRLYPRFDHLVVILVGTTCLSHLYPGLDHPEQATVLGTPSPWMPFASYRAR